MKQAITLLILACVAACATSRDAILSRAMAGLSAADKAFVAADARLQDEIVAKADSEADGRRQLAEYRVRRDVVTVAFIGAYTAVAIASTDLNATSLGEAVKAVAGAVAAYRGLR